MLNRWIDEALTGFAEEEQHGKEDVVEQLEADAVGKDGVPEQQQVLHGELSAKQQAHPPTEPQIILPFIQSNALVTAYVTLRSAMATITNWKRSKQGQVATLLARLGDVRLDMLWSILPNPPHNP